MEDAAAAEGVNPRDGIIELVIKHFDFMSGEDGQPYGKLANARAAAEKAQDEKATQAAAAAMETVEAVFTATDLDGNGELDSDEMVARYGTEAGKIMKEFGMTSPEDTITKEEFVSVLDRKYHEDPVQTGKWVQFLANPPGVSKSGQRTAHKAFAPDALNAELEENYITMTTAYESAKEVLRQKLLEYDEPHQSEDYLRISCMEGASRSTSPLTLFLWLRMDSRNC